MQTIDNLLTFCQGNIIPLAPHSKEPTEKEWTSKPSPFQSVQEVYTYLSLGYNIGYAIPPEILVIDVDPKNGGNASFSKLPASIHHYPPTTHTPSGGVHIYTTLPPGTEHALLRTTLKAEYPGIDFLHHGRQVVLPGSILSAELIYQLNENAILPPPPTPQEILDIIKRPERTSFDEQQPSGYLTSTDLMRALQELPVTRYDDNDSWLSLMFACHHATNGEGLEAFLEWSLSDPKYADRERDIRARWSSASIDKEGTPLITVRTLCREINQHGAVPSWLRVKAGLAQSPDTLFTPLQAHETISAYDQYRAAIQAEKDYYQLLPVMICKIASDSSLLESHREILYKLIATKTGSGMGAIKKDLQALSKSNLRYTPPPPPSPLGIVDSGQPIDDAQINLRIASALVDTVTARCFGVAPLYVAGQWWLWNGLHWAHELSDADLKRTATEVIQNFGVIVNTTNTTGIVDLAKIQCSAKYAALTGDTSDIRIFTKNCVLRFSRDRRQWTVENPDYRNRNLSIINLTYDSEAPEPVQFKQFLGEVLSSEHAQRTFACALVYTLGGVTPWLRKAFFLYGPPRTGKSTLLNVIEKGIIGQHNCSALNITQLGSKNGPAELVGKLANISNETLSKKAFQDDTFKALISGETIMVEQKFKDPFAFRNTSKLWMAANGFPRIEDESEAVWDRLVLFAFKHETPYEEADHNLEQKLAAEGQGILLWAIQIFTEEYLRDECRSIMEPDEEGRKALLAWRRINNPALEWVKDRIVYTGVAQDRLHVDQAYEDYCAWCNREGHYRAAKNQFSRVVNRKLSSVLDGRGKAIYTGVALETIEFFGGLSN